MPILPSPLSPLPSTYDHKFPRGQPTPRFLHMGQRSARVARSSRWNRQSRTLYQSRPSTASVCVFPVPRSRGTDLAARAFIRDRSAIRSHSPNPQFMAKQRNRRRKEVEPQSPFDQARDEMFQHIIRCGVIGSAPEDQREWFDRTIEYLEDRYHELDRAQVLELRTLGERFCQPPKSKQEDPADTAAA